MATLTSNSIASTYTMLLKMDATGVTSSLQKVEDGDATDSALSISTVAAALDATDKFYFDGGTHTYIYESADDILDIYVGGANMIKLTESSTDTVLITGDLTVGADGSGHDVIFYSGTAGDNFTWDASAEKLTITGTDGQTALDIADGNLVVADNIDLAGDIDVDGTLEADAITVAGTALDEYIADTIGAMVGSNTESGIAVDYQDGDNTLDFTVATLNQDTTGTADNITVSANNSTDETVYPVFVDGATGSQGAESDTGLTYNPSSGDLAIGGELAAATLDVSGNIDIDGTANLDAVDIDGAVDMASTLTIGGNIDFNSGTIDLSTQTVDVTLNAAVDALNFDSNTLSIDASNNRVGIGTAAIPHGGIGGAKLAIHGTNASASAGPHVQYTAPDNYPLFQQLNYEHDEVHLNFDAYYDGAWKSSDAGSNFAIAKQGDFLRFKYDSGIAQGSTVTWNNGIMLSPAGNVGIGKAPETWASSLQGGSLHVGAAGVIASQKAFTDGGSMYIGNNVYVDDGGDYTYIGSDEASIIQQFDGKIRFYTTSTSGSAGATISDLTEIFTCLNTGNIGIGDTDPSEAKLSITGVQSGDVGIKVEQDQAQYGISIDQDGNQSALFIDADNTDTHTIRVADPKNTTGDVLAIYQVDALTTGSIASFVSDSSSTGTRSLVEIINDNALATGATGLHIQQDGGSGTAPALFIDVNLADASGIRIDSEATSQSCLHIPDPKTQAVNVVNITDCDALTAGSIMQLHSNASGTQSRDLLHITNDNTAATGAVCLKLTQDSDDAHIEFAGVGGGGIKFPATQAASADANTLDDYEEGAWLPVIKDASANAMTMHASYKHGRYTKVGRVVHINAYFATSSLGSASGNIKITGLPFTCANNNNAYSACVFGYTADLNISAGETIGAYIAIDTTEMPMRNNDHATGSTVLQASEWSADGQAMLSMSYTV